MIGESARLDRCRNLVVGLFAALCLVPAASAQQSAPAPASAPQASQPSLDAAIQVEDILRERYRITPSELVDRLGSLLQGDPPGLTTAMKANAYNAVASANERLAQDASANAASDPGAQRRADGYITAAVTAYNRAGAAAAAGGDFAVANEAYNQALAHRPADLEALLGIARVHAGSQRYLKAIEAYQDYIKATGRKANAIDSSLYVELGRVYMGAQLWNQAIRAFQDAILNGRKTDEIAGSLANCYLGLNDMKRAQAEIEFAIEQNKSQPGYYGQLALLLINSSDLPNAAKQAELGVAVARERRRLAPFDRTEVKVLDDALSIYVRTLSRLAGADPNDLNSLLLLSQIIEEQAETRRLLGVHDALNLIRTAPPKLRDLPQLLERQVSLEQKISHPELRSNCERLLRVSPGNETARKILLELDKAKAASRPAS